MNEDNVTWLDPVNRPTNDQQPYLNLPELKWPYFWVIEISSSSIYLHVRAMRWWWPLRIGIIENKAGEYVSHKGDLTQAMLDELAGKGVEMAKQCDPEKAVLKQFKAVKFNRPVRVKKY